MRTANADLALARLEEAAQAFRDTRARAKAMAKKYEEDLIQAAREKRDAAVREAYGLLLSGHGVKHMDIKRAMGTVNDATYKAIVDGVTAGDVVSDWTTIEPYLTKPWVATLSGAYSEDYLLTVNGFYRWTGEATFELAPGPEGNWIPYRKTGQSDVWGTPETEDFPEWSGVAIGLKNVPQPRREQILATFQDWVNAEVAKPLTERSLG